MTDTAKTVLVVDDSPTVRQLVELNLKKISGIRIVQAVDGKQALEKIASEKPSIVLSDVNMPNMNGIELVEAIRTTDKTLPVVLITTKGEPGDAERGLAAGATAYITKPIDGAKLVETVRSLLA